MSVDFQKSITFAIVSAKIELLPETVKVDRRKKPKPTEPFDDVLG